MSRRKKKSNLTFPTVSITISTEEVENAVLNNVAVHKFPAYQVIVDYFKNKYIKKIICIGIGDLCKSLASRLQTAFILNVAKECSINDLFFFDPISCENCQMVLKKLGFECGSENTEGCFPFQENVAFYMPHCPRFIYHNLLVSNWEPPGLKNLIIIGNSFENYEEKCRLFLQPIRTCVEDLFEKGAVNEIQLDFLKNEFYDSTSLMTINDEKLDKIDDTFWKKRDLMHEAPSSQ